MTADVSMTATTGTPAATAPEQPAWSLSGTYLTPTHAALQDHAARMQRQSTTDPLITLSLHSPPAAPTTLTIHQSLLRATRELSAITPSEPIHEHPDTFDVIRKYLYLQPIDVPATPPDAALAALRWGLTDLHRGLFAISGPPQRWLGLLAGADASDGFKREFVRRFVGAVDRSPGLLEGGFGDVVGELRTTVRDGSVPTWPVLRERGMVVDVVRALIRFGERDYGARVLDVVMSGFGVLGQRMVEEVLEALEWESGYGEVLERCGGRWDGDAWKALVGVRDRVRFGWDEIRICLEGDEFGRWETGKDVMVCEQPVRLILAVESNRKGMGVSVRSVGEVAQGKKRVRVRVSVGGVCRCVDDGVDVVAQEEVPLVAFGRIGGVGVRVLDAAALREFSGKHGKCRLRVCVRLLLLRDVHHVGQVRQVELWDMMTKPQFKT